MEGGEGVDCLFIKNIVLFMKKKRFEFIYLNLMDK